MCCSTTDKSAKVVPDGDNGDSDNDGHAGDQNGGGGSSEGGQANRPSPSVRQIDAAPQATHRSEKDPTDHDDDSQPKRLSDDVSLT